MAVFPPSFAACFTVPSEKSGAFLNPGSITRQRTGGRFSPLRFFRYRWIQVRRHPDPPALQARSVFLGVFASFLVPVGHVPAAVILAWIGRANKWVAALATLVHVPPMYAVTWPLQYWIGRAMVPSAPAWSDIEHRLMHKQPPLEFLSSLAQIGRPFLLAFTLGGMVIGTALGAVLSFSCFRLITSHRLHQELKRQEKLRAQL